MPKEYWVYPDGRYSEELVPGTIKVFFQEQPFRLCLSCWELYSRQEREFRKLGRLSSEGRSSATTVLSVAALLHAKEGGIRENERKVLSFTDNRQDASLQAGHFNDFVRFSLLRAALYQALEARRELHYKNATEEVLAALDLYLSDIAKNPSLDPGSPIGRRVMQTFRDIVEYRIYEDLQRVLRVVQPNLEQCGLLQIQYLGLPELCADEKKWRACPAMLGLAPEERLRIIKTFLDYFRRHLAINAPCLQETLAAAITAKTRTGHQ